MTGQLLPAHTQYFLAAGASDGLLKTHCSSVTRGANSPALIAPGACIGLLLNTVGVEK